MIVCMPEGEGLCCHFGVFLHEGDPTHRAPLLGFPTPWEVVWYGQLVPMVLAGTFENNRYTIL